MRPYFFILAIAVTGSYSLEYNDQIPSNPLDVISSQSQLTRNVHSFSGLNQNQGLNQIYNNPLSSHAIQSGNLDSSSSFSSNVNSISGYNYDTPRSSSGNLDSSSSFNSGTSSFAGYNYHTPSSSSLETSESDSSSSFSSVSNNIPSFKTPQQQKSIYVYTAPPEVEVENKQIYIPPPAANTKIIFIKAPSQPQIRTQIIPHVPKEDKTLVYVLVKKPEDPIIDVKPTPSANASKPEVYFIRYNTKKEPHGVIGDLGDSASGELPIVEDNRRGKVAINFDSSISSSGNSNIFAPSPQYGPTRHENFNGFDSGSSSSNVATSQVYGPANFK